MRKYIFCSKILLVFILIQNASPESPRCERRLVCGSDGQVYETSCDFERALRLDQGLGTLPLHECLGMLYVVMPAENLWTPGNSKSALMSARRNNRQNDSKKFDESVKKFTRKVIEGLGSRDKALKAVEVMKNEVNNQVNQLVQHVDRAMKQVLEQVKKRKV